MLYANQPFQLSEQLLLAANIEAIIVLKAKKPRSGTYIQRSDLQSESMGA